MENDTKEIIKILNKAMDNMELLFQIINDIINNFDEKKINFQNLNLIENINNNSFINDLNSIINDIGIINKFNNIINMIK